MNGSANTLWRLPERAVLLAVGLSLVYVNTSAIAWYPSSTLGWGPGEIEVDGRQDSCGHLGWPVTYYFVSGGGLERRPSSWWMYIPLGATGMTAFLGPVQLIGNTVWASALLFATWHVSVRAVDTARRGQFSLRASFAAVTLAALVAFLVFNYRGDTRFWHDYDEISPYLTWSALYHWFGSRSLFDWLCRFPFIVRVPILLGWLSLVVFVSSSLVAFSRRVGRHSTMSSATTSGVQSREVPSNGLFRQ